MSYLLCGSNHLKSRENKINFLSITISFQSKSTSKFKVKQHNCILNCLLHKALGIFVFYFQLMPCTQQIKAVIAYVNSQAFMKYYRVFIGGKFTMIASTLLSMIVFVLSLGFESLNIIIKKSTEEYPVVILIAIVGVAGFIWLLSFLSILGVRRCVSILCYQYDLCFIINLIKVVL